MKLLIGLGNIGPHFDNTRHNVGFAALDAFAAAHGLEWHPKEKFKALVAEGVVNGKKVILAKPTTYYNLSGEAARAIKDFYKLENSDIIVAHDELALQFGTVRTRQEGSDAGNNGIKSMVAHIGSDIARIRIGIANPELQTYDAADFVLGHFTHEEQAQLPTIIKHAHDAFDAFINGQFTLTTKK